MGAVWDPRLFSLFEVEDQIRLGNWVSYPGEGKMVAVPMESRLSLSTPKSFALFPPRTVPPHNLCSERSYDPSLEALPSTPTPAGYPHFLLPPKGFWGCAAKRPEWTTSFIACLHLVWTSKPGSQNGLTAPKPRSVPFDSWAPTDPTADCHGVLPYPRRPGSHSSPALLPGRGLAGPHPASPTPPK